MKIGEVLIDAVFINNGGGKILLDYLILELKNSEISHITLLLDNRVRGDTTLVESDQIKIVYANGFRERNGFYRRLSPSAFSKVLCFGNVPPNIRLDAEVYTYFHNPMYLSIPKEFGLIKTLLFRLKIQILKCFRSNTDYWIVQNAFIKNSLSQKFSLDSKRIWIIPFYPPLTIFTAKRIRGSFLYVSNATPHKNHVNLIDAFCMYYDEFKDGILTLTVSTEYPEVFQLIERRKKEGYPIENVGFVNRSKLEIIYAEHEYLIFPSLTESFGLGIVEAIECGCKVIGADLPYLYQVCEPSLVFDPLNKINIYQRMVESRNTVQPTRQVIYNDVKKMINLLK